MATKKASKVKVIKALAGVLSGAQVPLSMGMLGAAAKPLTDLRDMLGLFGYPDAAEHEKRLKEILN